mmetsp:Transcript_31673/g.41940  ORF Transcript_31673/g.41940 Transcript_31673/m.41940 type:complete len:130 (+) Transcript_31673:55-444(+)
MLTQNKYHDPARHEQNRTIYAREQDLMGSKPRNALFSMPASLTAGDTSNCYQTFRKERHEVGLNKGMTINQCRGAKETFGNFKSNALGDPFQDPGQYFLRKPRSTSTKPRPFVTCSNKLVRKSEFEYYP